MESSIANTILRVSLQPTVVQPIYANQRQSATISGNQRPKNKPGRNDPCPCSKINPETGKPMKYKKCCWPKYG